MKILKNIRSESSYISHLIRRVKTRNFSGNEGIAIKNSIFQFSTNIVTKIGSLIFIVLFARLVSPEVFGLFNITLSTIMIFYIFADLGVNQTVIYFVSRELGRNKISNSSKYLNYLLKIKIALISFSVILIVSLGKFISANYYKQPIFLALICGAFFIIFTSLQSFLVSFSQAQNNFKIPFFKEFFLQTAKTVFIIPIIILLNKSTLSYSTKIASIFSFLAILSFLSLLLIFFLLKKSYGGLKLNKKSISQKEKRNARNFVINISFISSIMLIFGQLDKVILGGFVAPEYVGYYSAAINLIISSVYLIVFSDTFFPIFLRMKEDKLALTFKKSVKMTLLLSFILFIFVFLFSEILINLIFSSKYEHSISILRLFSFVIIVIPLIELYNSYLISQGKVKNVSIFLFFMLLVNIFLPYFAIKLFISHGPMAGVYSLTIAMVICKFLHLIGLMLISRKV